MLSAKSLAALDALGKATATVARMDARHIYFALGVIALMLLCGYVRDLGKKAGVSPSTVALFERLALLA
jgi:hypothetical protein